MNVDKNYDKDFVVTAEVIKPMIVASTSNPTPPQRLPRAVRIVTRTFLITLIVIIAIGFYGYQKFRTPVTPQIYPTIIDIPKGSSLQAVTTILEEKGIISSPLLFRMSMIFIGAEHSIKTGEYTFNGPVTLTQVVDKLVNGKYEYVPVRLTIREGQNAHEIMFPIKVAFPKLVEADIYAAIKDKEGRLFPETYIFAPFATLDEVLKTIDKEYQKRIAVFKDRIASSGKTEQEILTIASILEREVAHKDDMKIVSGIIYNRLAKGMPLQMDSTLGHITGKASLELVSADLAIDSPYNTYIYKGLPPGPIGSPGDVAIDASLSPESHKYIFFLSDKEGINHYAVTYAEHLKNRRLYLGK